jgi:hypothetical protein
MSCYFELILCIHLLSPLSPFCLVLSSYNSEYGLRACARIRMNITVK